jgi:hypothetical protein
MTFVLLITGGAYDDEVTSVDGRDVGNAQAFNGGDDGGIHCAQRQVAVTRD